MMNTLRRWIAVLCVLYAFPKTLSCQSNISLAQRIQSNHEPS